MEIHCSDKTPGSSKEDMLVYFIPEMDEKTKLPAAIKKEVGVAFAYGDFSGKKAETHLFYKEKGKKKETSRILVVGLGQREKDKDEYREQLRLAGGTAVNRAMQLKVKKFGVVLPALQSLSPSQVAEALTQGLLLGNYRFDKYKSKKDDDEQTRPVQAFCLYSGEGIGHALKGRVREAKHAAMAACKARDMANEPGDGWTPAHFADFAEKLAKTSDLKCRIFEKQDMKKMGMGGILGVNRGAAKPPKLVVLEYHAGKKKPTLLLVGKGLTFDSGGISIKPSAGMEDMKYDMCGGAAVLCAMQAIAALQPKNANVVALVPATENMPGGAAIKPGDILTHYNGKTSEVINTDAEGRLILADALAYGVKKYKPDAIVDLATLTGAVIIGLGHHRTGILSNNDGLVDQIMAAGKRCGEPLWRLPLGSEYSKQLKSEVADFKNIGGRPAGTITAACFLQEFVDDTPWAHLDIAGTAWGFTEKSYIPKGPSGIAVRTLIDFVENWKALEK